MQQDPRNPNATQGQKSNEESSQQRLKDVTIFLIPRLGPAVSLGASLRDKAENTRLLILAFLHQGSTTLSEVANRLEVTVQAVSLHTKHMVNENLLRMQDSTPRLTAKGLQHLHEGLRRLRDTVNLLSVDLNVIHATSAIAETDIAAGELVRLWMQDGDLAARPGTGESTGKASHDAKAGDEVVVTELHGIVDLAPGSVTVMAIPGPEEGGLSRIDDQALDAILAKLGRFDRIAALGTGARIAARRRGQLDIEFASDVAAWNAAERGLHVLLWATRERLPEVVHTFAEGRTRRQIATKILEAPERP